MAEIKHTFTAGKMNKDLDERLVPNGEYRDALNIQVRTTDGDASGTVQNLLGNELSGVVYNTIPLITTNSTKCIGSVSDERNDKAYFLYASEKLTYETMPKNGLRYWVDTVLEQESNGFFTSVVVDFYGVSETKAISGIGTQSSAFTSLSVASGLKYRVGMVVKGFDTNGNNKLLAGTRITKIVNNTIHLNKLQPIHGDLVTNWMWKHEGALNFNYDSIITGINVIDDFLFYTDGVNEPKKINIRRCKSGTAIQPTQTSSSLPIHTKLKLDTASGTLENLETTSYNNGDLKLEHLTVIKKAPRTAPEFTMSSSSRLGEVSHDFEALFNTSIIGSSVVINNFPPAGSALVEGDVVLIDLNEDSQEPVQLRAQIDNIETDDFIGCILIIMSLTDNITNQHNKWNMSLVEDSDVLFELKFPKFGYRYKYNDNEYSSFSPWSEVAFMPGYFDYAPKKGHNLGMTNLLREITITNLLADERVRPDEVQAIDILYKSTDSPTAYVVRTIEKNIDPEFSSITSINSSDVKITSEMIHIVISSDQSIRAWDNVPKSARAQEIVGNRLMYGNYTQGYNLSFNLGIDHKLKSQSVVSILSPNKSIKSIRSYKFGAVFGDRFGRETPVISSGVKLQSNEASTDFQSNDAASISKKEANKSNAFYLTQNWGQSDGINNLPDDWMNYVKYYIKETSNEYYNLVMDRWYNASDGNVWISFPSSERNKIDDETYLILKTKNGYHELVEEKARYKVISISSEAPDFIKTDVNILGDVPISDDDTVMLSNIPTGLIASNSFSLDFSSWSAFIGSLTFKGQGKFRIVATWNTNVHKTSFKNITNIIFPTEDLTGSISTSFPWGLEADFPQMFSLIYDETVANIVDGVGDVDGIVFSLEIADSVIENKPEFDGRFFVKVERDFVLESKVMNLSTIGSQNAYVTESSFDLTYINPGNNGDTEAHPSANIDQNFYNVNNSSWSTLITPPSVFTTAGIDATSNFDAGGNVLTHSVTAFWQNWNDGKKKIFIDGVPGYKNIDEAVGSADSAVWEAHLSSDNFEERGFSKSGINGMDEGTYDRLFFSITKGDKEVHEGEWESFQSLMTTQNTLFRFKNDPLQNVYGIVSGANDTRLWNNAIEGEAGLTRKRFSFYTNFKKVDQGTGLLIDEGINFADWDARSAFTIDGSKASPIDIVSKVALYDGQTSSSYRGSIWETEPKDSADLDIYYEASSAIPMNLDNNNTCEFAPQGCTVKTFRHGLEYVHDNAITAGASFDSVVRLISNNADHLTNVLVGDEIEFHHTNGTITRSRVTGWVEANLLTSSNTVKQVVNPSTAIKAGPYNSGSTKLTTGMTNSSAGVSADLTISGGNLGGNITILAAPPGAIFFSVDASNSGDAITNLSESDNTQYILSAGTTATGYYLLDSEVYKYPVKIPWFNCYSFGNGVESDRIRDDFNSNMMGNGEKVSTTFLNYKQEVRSNGLIYSGIYNSNSSFNALNEFNMSQRITKDLNPTYGSIQVMKTRNSDVTVFTEDKVLKVLANKDALFNADGNANLTATDRVLGQAVPFSGDYGISKNPESLACDNYRMYFTDKQRGAVLRLSMDGLTPISNVGMRTWFRDNLPKSNSLVGSFDIVNGEYNVSVVYEPQWVGSNYSNTTVSFNEASKGWSSFKSFVQDAGLSVSGTYFTSKNFKSWKHYSTISARNSFYGVSSAESSVTMLINDSPGSVKNFKTLNYEGSQGYQISINNYSLGGQTYNDGDFSAVTSTADTDPKIDGWQVHSIKTDINNSVHVPSFSKKEGKWHGSILGSTMVPSTTQDPGDFSTQGLGVPTSVQYDGVQANYNLIIDGPE